jgi:hypothetical protein
VVFKLSVAAGFLFPCPVLAPASVGGVVFFAEEIQAAHRFAFFGAQSEKRVVYSGRVRLSSISVGGKVLGSFISAPGFGGAGSRFRGIRLTPWTPAKALMTGTAR